MDRNVRILDKGDAQHSDFFQLLERSSIITAAADICFSFSALRFQFSFQPCLSNAFTKPRRATLRRYDTALAEIRRGRKTSHWIWYIFPQLDGLGRSSTARAYALGDLAEACAYLRDPLLPRALRRNRRRRQRAT